MFEDIFCALSGITPNDNELLDSDIPLGWVKVSLERQFLNPQWAAVQLVKRGMIESTLASIPEADRELQRMGIEIQVNASFHAYEQDIDQFITIGEDVFISPPENSDEMKKEWDKFCNSLGLDVDFLAPTEGIVSTNDVENDTLTTEE